MNVSPSMSWEERIIKETELDPYRRVLAATDLPSKVEALINHQTIHWSLLSEGIQALSQVIVKRIPLESFDVFAQFNPKRIVSTAAAVDKTSIQNRPCFLCEANLPPEEKGLAYGDAFVILCNPFPILDRHLSIVHKWHVPQAIAGRFETMLDLAKDLSPEFFVLYNGPQCGASAPDHFHLQAASRKGLPLEDHMALIRAHPELGARERGVLKTDGVEIFTLKNDHWNVLICRSSDREALTRWFYRIIEIMADLTGNRPEPLINLIVTFDEPDWTVYLFPRGKHRPACYYAEGDDKLLVSPGATDLAGCLVVPVEAHFQKIDAEAIKQIFSEVTLGGQLFSHLVKTLSAC
ncbi:MAG: DUF4922 domain-containing protein [Acidobacteria bacterium]|nr:DUF4922 domain-containing protein [Acidobacteriota bacterium]